MTISNWTRKTKCRGSNRRILRESMDDGDDDDDDDNGKNQISLLPSPVHRIKIDFFLLALLLMTTCMATVNLTLLLTDSTMNTATGAGEEQLHRFTDTHPRLRTDHKPNDPKDTDTGGKEEQRKATIVTHGSSVLVIPPVVTKTPPHESATTPDATIVHSQETLNRDDDTDATTTTTTAAAAASIPVYVVTRRDCRVRTGGGRKSRGSSSTKGRPSAYARILGHIRTYHRILYENDEENENDDETNQGNEQNDAILIVEEPGLDLEAPETENSGRIRDIVPQDFLRSGWKSIVDSAPMDWNILTLSLQRTTKHQNEQHSVMTNTTTSEELFQLRASKLYQNGDLWMSWSPFYLGGLKSYIVRKHQLAQILEESEYDSEYEYTEESSQTLMKATMIKTDGTANPTPAVPEELLFFTLADTSRVYSSTMPPEELSKPRSGASLRNVAVASQNPSILVVTTIRIADVGNLEREVRWLQTDANELARVHTTEGGGKYQWQVWVVVTREDLLEAANIAFGEIQTSDNNGVSPFRTNLKFEFVVNPEVFNKYNWIHKNKGLFKDFDRVIMKDSDQRIAGMPWRTFLKQSSHSLLASPLREIKQISLLKARHKPFEIRSFQARAWMGDVFPQNNSIDPYALWSKDKFYNARSLEVPLLEQYFVSLDTGFASWYFDVSLSAPFLDQHTDWGIDAMWCAAARDYLLAERAISQRKELQEYSSCVLSMTTSVHEDTKSIGFYQNGFWYDKYVPAARKALVLHQENVEQAKKWHSERIYKIFNEPSLKPYCSDNSTVTAPSSVHHLPIKCIQPDLYTF